MSDESASLQASSQTVDTTSEPAVEESEPLVRGYVEILNTDVCAGWVSITQNNGEFVSPVDICVLVDGDPLVLAPATQSRRDVNAAGVGPEHCGFRVPLSALFSDGLAHRVTIIENSTGHPIEGGQAELRQDLEGVAFLDRSQLAICGWARGSSNVRVRLDEEADIVVPLNLPVPGFAADIRVGFKLPLPPSVTDGEWHQAQAWFGMSDTPLDGAPFSFRVDRDNLHVSITQVLGSRIYGEVRNFTGKPVSLPVIVDINGRRFKTFNTPNLDENMPPQILRSEGCFSLVLPHGTESITLKDGRTEEQKSIAHFKIFVDPMLQQRQVVDGGTIDQSSTENEISIRTLNENYCLDVSHHFAEFSSEHQGAFDEIWYSSAYPEVKLQVKSGDFLTPIEHYCKIGAREGKSPNPYFDEMRARSSFPAIADAIESGRIPAAFALEFHAQSSLFRQTPFNAIAMLSGKLSASEVAQSLAKSFAPEEPTQDESPGKSPVPANLPPPTAWREPSKNIYAAWLNRLDVKSEERAFILTDEEVVRTFIKSTPLMQAPLVSIIMPTFNRAYTIGESIQSVIDQTYGNWELLICDDASIDKTPEVIRQFNDARIRYMPFLKSNGAGTRNKGLRFARGEYIAYLDSDNMWNPHFLDLMLRKLFQNPGTALAYSTYLDTEIIGGTVSLLQAPHPTFRPVELNNRNFMDLNTIVHHRCVYDWLQGFDPELQRLQDWDLMLRYTSVFRPLYVDHFMVFYRRNVAWGQVTNLFMGSAAKDTVNEKTTRRISGDHARLAIEWPRRGRQIFIAGGNPTDQLILYNLARMASEVCDVDLVILGQRNASLSPTDTLNIHWVPRDLQVYPERIQFLLFDRMGGASVIAHGVDSAFLKRLMREDYASVFTLEMTEHGIALANNDNPRAHFHLGTAVLSPVEPQNTDHSRKRKRILMLGVRNMAEILNSYAVAMKLGYEILVPPSQGLFDEWRLLTSSQDKMLAGVVTDEILDVVNSCAFCVVRRAFRSLSLLEVALVTHAQCTHLPLAVVSEKKKKTQDYFDEIIVAGGAYDITVNKPEWIFDKLDKLVADATTLDRLRSRARKVYEIVNHEQLLRERLFYFLHEVNFGGAGK